MFNTVFFSRVQGSSSCKKHELITWPFFSGSHGLLAIGREITKSIPSTTSTANEFLRNWPDQHNNRPLCAQPLTHTHAERDKRPESGGDTRHRQQAILIYMYEYITNTCVSLYGENYETNKKWPTNVCAIVFRRVAANTIYTQENAENTVRGANSIAVDQSGTRFSGT